MVGKITPRSTSGIQTVGALVTCVDSLSSVGVVGFSVFGMVGSHIGDFTAILCRQHR